MCPTTERDLADGIGPAARWPPAGCPMTLGSDSHAVIDLFEEARAVELDERLRTERRGHWPAAELLRAATAAGHASLGWPDAGRLEAGALADFVAVALDTVRTAGPRRGSVRRPWSSRRPPPTCGMSWSAAGTWSPADGGAPLVGGRPRRLGARDPRRCTCCRPAPSSRGPPGPADGRRRDPDPP